MRKAIYYNKSGYYDPTAGTAISNTDKDHSFYDTPAWRRCRSAFMKSKYYVCERCGGVAVLAHHKKYITAENVNDPKITLSWSNLEALCSDCHNKEHGTSSATADGISFDGDGNVVYTPHTPKSNWSGTHRWE